ncbi:Beta,beta-carotene 9',10'-oxygenase [Nymphon striatum]|nr:Beta,beta-carotene 9',10'-oxygenase [Nymphon striatum]
MSSVEELDELYRVRYLQSCNEDVEKPVFGDLKGEIPKWIKGSLLRNGPGCYEFGTEKYQHYFDGTGMLHKFSIFDGQATYMNKLLKCESFKENINANRIVVNQFGTSAYPDPCMTLFQRFMSWFSVHELSDNANVNLVKYSDKIYASTETPYMYNVNCETLCTGEKLDVSKYTSVFVHTAHAHSLRDGKTLNFGLGYYFGGSAYKLIEFPAENGIEVFQKAKTLATIPSRWRLHPSYFHSFCVTENYVIFIEQSLVISIPALAGIFYKQFSFSQSLQYENEKVIFHVIDKQNGQRVNKKFTSEPFFFFHSVNSYEENENIVLDLCCYNNSELIESFDRSYRKPNTIFGHRKSFLKRFVLPLIDKTLLKKGENMVMLESCKAEAKLLQDGSIDCIPEIYDLQGHSIELPQINYAVFNGKKYRYAYGVGAKYEFDEEEWVLKLLKFDLKTKELKTWFCYGLLPSEPVFIPHPDAETEDHGVILSSVLSLDTMNFVCLLIMDAQNFTEIARVTFKTPNAIPKDIHGIFLND